MKSFAVSVSRLKAFWVLVICIVGTYLKNKKSYREYFKTYRWLIVLVLFSFTVILLAGYSNARVHFGTEFFSLMALVGLLNHSNVFKNYSIIPKILLVPIIVLVGFVLYYQKVNFDNFKVCENQMCNSNTLMILTPTDRIPSIWNNYLMKHVDYGEDVYYLACDKNKTMVRYMSALYGKTGMFYFPRTMYDDMINNPSKYDDFTTLPDVGLYVKRCNDKKEGKVMFELDEVKREDIPFYLLPVYKWISTYSSTTCSPTNQTIVTINNDDYLVVPEPIEGKAERVKRVILQ